MSNLSEYIHSLGTFHDCVVTGFDWDASADQLQLSLKDLFENFNGLPEYPGFTPGSFRFRGVTKFSADLDLGERELVISEVQVSESPEIRINILFWNPVGKLAVSCASVIVESDQGERWPGVRTAK